MPSVSEPVSLLGALQLADSFFPSGLYTLSHGLESFIQQGWLRSLDELVDLLEDYVTGMIGSAELPLHRPQPVRPGPHLER